MLSCRVASYRPFEELAFAHLASLGVRHVEIPLPAPDEVDATRATLQQHGLSAASLHGTCDIRQPDVADQVAAQLPTLAAFGCKLLFVSVSADDTPLDQAYHRLRAAGSVAAEHGVTIVMETHPDLVTNARVALETMRGVDHPNVRVNYDTANVYFYNHNVDTVTELQQVVPNVAAVHLKDTDGGYRHWHFPALGQGIVDFARVFQVLDEHGFAGPCTLEIEGLEGEKKTADLVRQRVSDSVEYLRRLARW